MMNDPIIDLIIRIKNAYMTKNESLVSPHSTYREAVVKKLKEIGYIEDYSVDGDVIKTISIQLKAYGLIDIRYSQTTNGGMALFWSLTPKGERLMTEVRVIRRGA